MQERMRQIYSQLSPLETRILRLYLSGMSYSEIASTCNRPLKSVDNAVQAFGARSRGSLNRANPASADRI